MAITLTMLLFVGTCMACPAGDDDKIGLVLSGGGAKGAYEVGVWQHLVEQSLHRKVAAISGTSVGAINAALFAAVSDTNACASLWREDIDPIFRFNTNLIVKVLGAEGEKKLNGVYDSMRSNIVADCRAEARRRRCAVAELSPDVVSEISNRCEAVARNKLFLQLPKLKTLACIFADFDASKPIEGFLSPSVLYSCIMRDLPTVWRVDAPDVYATALKKEENYTFRAVRFSVRREEPERRASMICASACIPLVFGAYGIDGDIYVDGGMEEKGGDNTPIGPILERHLEIKTVIVVYLHDVKHLKPGQLDRVRNAAKEKGVRLIEIIPSENIDGGLGLGLFDTSPDTARRLIELGRKDAQAALQKVEL